MYSKGISNQNKRKIMPPTYFLVLLLLSIGLHFLLSVKQIIYPSYTYLGIILGIILTIMGIVLNIWSDSLFKKNKTTVKPHETPSKLIITGPFCISRHPMYLGMAMILLGITIFLGSLVTFAFPIIFVILMELMFIPFEEENLEKTFKQEYINYKERVRSWV